MMEKTVLQATSVQHQDVITTLSDAFMTDPALRFIIPDENTRARALPKLFAVMVPDDSRSGRGCVQEMMKLRRCGAIRDWRKTAAAQVSG
jgi:hypothetical protein